MRFRHAFLLTTGTQVAILALNFVASILVARALGPAGKGALSLILSTGGILALVLGFGLSGSLVVHIGGHREKLSQIFSASVLIGLVSAAVLAFLVGFWGNGIVRLLFPKSDIVIHPYWRILLFFFTLLTIWNTNIRTIFLGLQEFVVYNLSALFRLLFVYVPAIVLLYFTGRLTVTTALSSAVLSFVVVFVANLYLFQKGFKIVLDFGREARWFVGQLLSTGSRSLVSNLAGLLLLRSDFYLIAYLGGGAYDVGLYALAVNLIEMAGRLPKYAGIVLFPKVSSDKTGKTLFLVRKLFWVFGSISVVTGMLVFALPWFFKWLIGGLFGERFIASYPALLALTPRVILQTVTSPLAENLAGKGYPWYHPVGTVVGLALNIPLNFFLIPRYGIVGAGVASSISFIPTFIIYFIGFLKINKVKLSFFIGR
ncbi:oligosaccharide flippase family protein [bacterium]|nr:oligosaccharide flippase family protein [bacterium]